MTRALLSLSLLSLLATAAPALAQTRSDDAGDLAPPDHASWVEHDQSPGDHGGWTTTPPRRAHHVPRHRAHRR